MRLAVERHDLAFNPIEEIVERAVDEIKFPLEVEPGSGLHQVGRRISMDAGQFGVGLHAGAIGPNERKGVASVDRGDGDNAEVKGVAADDPWRRGFEIGGSANAVMA